MLKSAFSTGLLFLQEAPGVSEQGLQSLIPESVPAGFPGHWAKGQRLIKGTLHPRLCLPSLILNALLDTMPGMLPSFKTAPGCKDNGVQTPSLLSTSISCDSGDPVRWKTRKTIIFKRIPQSDVQLAPSQSHRECVCARAIIK